MQQMNQNHMKEESEEVPDWFLALINAKFNTSKRKNPNDLKYFCTDCAKDGITESMREAQHSGHILLKGYKDSGYYGYRIVDLDRTLKSRGLDTCGVFPYSINGHGIHFPKSRKSCEEYVPKHGVDKCCWTCGWGLRLEGYFYCSILCKLLHKFRNKPNTLAVLDSCKSHEEKKGGPLVLKIKNVDTGYGGGKGEAEILSKGKKHRKLDEEVVNKMEEEKVKNIHVNGDGKVETAEISKLGDDKKPLGGLKRLDWEYKKKKEMKLKKKLIAEVKNMKMTAISDKPRRKVVEHYVISI